VTAGRPSKGGNQDNHASVAEWVQIAEGDLATARREHSVRTDANLRAVAFHLQQAVEKLMKGVLRTKGIEAPKTHDLEVLESILRSRGVDPGANSDELGALATAAVEARYPGAPISEDDARFLLAIAEKVWAALRPLV
jgi:HEPN domain-containing protein